MSDTTPHDEPDEVEALTGQMEVHEGASPEDERPAAEPTVEDGGIDADREVELGTDDPSDQAELDAPD